MQWCIQQPLEGIEGIIAYIDDILVFAENEEAHDVILRKVLCHLHAKDFHLQLRKCQFCRPSISFLRQILSRDNIHPDLANVEAISKILMPTMHMLVCSFLGTVQHYSQYITKLTDMTEPLNAVLHDSKPFAWSDECQVAFEELKTVIALHLQLSLYDPRCPTHINVDASDVSLGATLTQEQGGKEVTICCVSHMLSATECHYSMVEKEGLGCLCGKV